MNKGGFSWKRLLGVTKAKRNISRKTGVPWTKSGREQKIGRILTKGCLGSIMCLLISFLSLLTLFLIW